MTQVTQRKEFHLGLQFPGFESAIVSEDRVPELSSHILNHKHEAKSQFKMAASCDIAPPDSITNWGPHTQTLALVKSHSHQQTLVPARSPASWVVPPHRQLPDLSVALSLAHLSEMCALHT